MISHRPPRRAARSVSDSTEAPPPRPDDEPARHILRQRTVAAFLENPYDPEGAIPSAIQKVIGGPPMWSEEAVSASQFTEEQRALVLRAFEEIKALYQEGGGRMQQVMQLIEGIGLMPAGNQWPYQSEKWAAARAMYIGQAYRFPSNLPESEREDAALTQAYYVVINWIDWVEGGLLDASAVYEAEEDDEKDERLDA